MAFHHLLIVLSATTFLSLGILIGVSDAQEETICRGVPINVTKEQQAQINDCLKESNISSIFKIPLDRIGCFGVCILKKKDLLTPDGKLHHDKIFAYIENAMKPDEVKKPIKDGVDKCFKEHGDKVDAHDGDTKCRSFLEVGICVHDVFYDICVEEIPI